MTKQQQGTLGVEQRQSGFQNMVLGKQIKPRQRGKGRKERTLFILQNTFFSSQPPRIPAKCPVHVAPVCGYTVTDIDQQQILITRGEKIT